MFKVEFTRSVKGKHPIARFRLNREECNTYCYVGCGRKDNNITYYGCNQCKGVDRNAKGCKQIHLNGTVIVNGDPSIGHKEGCKALRTAVVHAEDYKRRASKEVRVGTTTIGNARLHNHSLMLATCDEADVDETETRKSWVLKSLNSRLNKNKVMRVASITETGDLPQELK
uniref:Uncharacterized protein n=1 Tax=Plectus sambesii TaxID=2011161 RepID=A0A914XIA7_9BILA